MFKIILINNALEYYAIIKNHFEEHWMKCEHVKWIQIYNLFYKRKIYVPIIKN